MEDVREMISWVRVRLGLGRSQPRLFSRRDGISYQLNPKVYISAASRLDCPLATLHRSRSSSGVERVGVSTEFSGD